MKIRRMRNNSALTLLQMLLERWDINEACSIKFNERKGYVVRSSTSSVQQNN